MVIITETLVTDNSHLHRVFFKEGRRPWYMKLGFVLKFGSKFWAYNSFKCVPYLSNKEHMEVFQSSDSAKRWMEKYDVVARVVGLICKEGP